ncbi:hypothetical protein Droror1_Dr00005675 [Drosera rotundifolia]
MTHIYLIKIQYSMIKIKIKKINLKLYLFKINPKNIRRKYIYQNIQFQPQSYYSNLSLSPYSSSLSDSPQPIAAASIAGHGDDDARREPHNPKSHATACTPSLSDPLTTPNLILSPYPTSHTTSQGQRDRVRENRDMNGLDVKGLKREDLNLAKNNNDRLAKVVIGDHGDLVRPRGYMEWFDEFASR